MLNNSAELKVGDTYTIAGVYRRRTLWQWLTGQPRVLQVFTITTVVSSGGSQV
jgi:hypothetical protein